LWATFEIIVGSFLHNLRVPMAGTILAMISVIVMVAFHRHWKQKGLLWRAGLICALMKSISPSAILLGPMTGIMAEALLMEFFVRIFGGNMLGYMIGASFALMSTIAHKIVNLLMIYGFDIVTVLVNLYKYATEQIGFTNLEPKIALWALFGFYALLGIIASLIGFLVGKGKNKPDTENPELNKLPEYKPGSFFHLEANQHYSVKLLFFHVFAIIVSLVIISYSVVYGLLTAVMPSLALTYSVAWSSLSARPPWVNTCPVNVQVQDSAPVDVRLTITSFAGSASVPLSMQ